MGTASIKLVPTRDWSLRGLRVTLNDGSGGIIRANVQRDVDRAVYRLIGLDPGSYGLIVYNMPQQLMKDGTRYFNGFDSLMGDVEVEDGQESIVVLDRLTPIYLRYSELSENRLRQIVSAISEQSNFGELLSLLLARLGASATTALLTRASFGD